MPPREFRIEVADHVLDDLRERLARTRWPQPLPGEPWAHGASVEYVRELCAYWQREYDWR
jgi:microsomal epoxide hydrolase